MHNRHTTKIMWLHYYFCRIPYLKIYISNLSKILYLIQTLNSLESKLHQSYP